MATLSKEDTWQALREPTETTCDNCKHDPWTSPLCNMCSEWCDKKNLHDEARDEVRTPWWEWDGKR